MSSSSTFRKSVFVALIVVVLCVGFASPALASTASTAKARVRATQARLDAAAADYKKFDSAAAYANSTIVWLQTPAVRKALPASVTAALQARYAKTLTTCWDKAYASCVRKRSIEDLARIWRWWTRAGVKNRYRLGASAISSVKRNSWRTKIRNASNYEVTASSVHTWTVPSTWNQDIQSWATIPSTTFTARWKNSPNPSVAFTTKPIRETLDCDKTYTKIGGTAQVTLTKTVADETMAALIDPKLSEFPDDTSSPLAPLARPTYIMVSIMPSGLSPFAGTVEISDDDGVRTESINDMNSEFNSIGSPWFGRPGLEPFYEYHEGGGISGAGWLTPLARFQEGTEWKWNGSTLAEWEDGGRLAVSVNAPILTDDLEIIGWDQTSCTIQFKPK